MSTLVKTDIAQALGQAFIDGIYLQKSNYYYGFGRSYPWTDELNPPDAIESVQWEKEARNDVLYMRRIDGTSASFVIDRIDWVNGAVYDIYDDFTSTSGKAFYAINSDYNVYKCLFNGSGAQSLIEPYGTSANPLTLSDGYVWKYIYSVPPSLRNKFLNSKYMPIFNEITEAYYSRGSITSVLINNGGKDYASTGTQLIVQGDGYLEDNPYKLQAFLLSENGSGYLTVPSVTVKDFVTATDYTANMTVVVGQNIKVTDSAGERFYKAESSGQLGPVAPSNYYSTVTSGTVAVKHIGTKPKIVGAVNATAVGSVTVTDPGFGYVSQPSVTKTGGSGTLLSSSIVGGQLASVTVVSPGTGHTTTTVTVASPYADVALPLSTAVVEGAIYFVTIGSDRYFYQVTLAGTTSATNPTHTTGSAANGTAVLNVIGKRAKAAAVLGIVSGITAYRDVFDVTVLSGGTGYAPGTTTVTFTGGNPTTPATATAVVSDDGVVIDVIVTFPGYGYQSAPTVAIVGAGTDANVTPVLQYGYGFRGQIELDIGAPNTAGGVQATAVANGTKTDALLEPIIIDNILRGVRVVDGGIGYTSAVISVIGTGTGAELTPVFSSGELTSIQSQSELFAVPATISSIKVITAGSNISQLNYTVSGDGTGAEIEPVLENGSLKEVKVITAGEGYTFYNITFEANADSTLPTVRAIISPSNGHGSNPLKEFNAKSISLYGVFAIDTNNGFEIDNTFRQLTIFSNPLTFNETRLLTSKSGSACVNVTSSTTGVPIFKNAIVTAPDDSTYRVIDFNATNVLLQPITKGAIAPNNALILTVNDVDYQLVVSNIVFPTVDKYSGEVLFIDNLKNFRPTDNQTIAVNTVINLY